MPADLVEVLPTGNAPLGGRAAGSEKASQRQGLAAQQLGLPVEVKTRQTGIVLRLVPAGSFTMGSPPGEKGRKSDEAQHGVTLTTPFFCGKYEVTRAQWEQVMGVHLPDTDIQERHGDVPKDQVSWEDCQNFLRELCRAEDVRPGTYRLLTEAQWEYACRADTVTPFHHGNYLYPSMANFNEAYVRSHDRERPGQDALIPVGSKKPNAWGLHDMHGNVLEWCTDWYGSYPSPLSEVNPEGADAGERRVARGGAWMSKAASCRSAARDSFWPDRRSDYLGFRLMRPVLQPVDEGR